LVRDGNDYYFAGLNKATGEGQIYKYNVGADPVKISEPIKDFLLTLVTYYDAVVANDKYYLSLERSGSNPHLVMYDGNSWHKYTTLAVQMNTLGVKKHTNNKILFDYTQYIGGYSDSPPGTVDSQDTGSTEIVPTIRTKTFRMPEGIRKARLRFLKFNYKKRSGQDTLIKIYDADTGDTDTFTDNTGSGWKTYDITIGGDSANVKKVNKLYVTVTGAGMEEWGNLRVEYRPIREGKAVAA
jgi:hypothetical protein